MSKPKYDWWPYVKGMVRRYPTLKQDYSDLHSMSVTPCYSAMPHGNEVSRTIENIALKELPKTQQREFAAVCKAIAITERYRDGKRRLTVIDLVLWKQSHTIAGAALQIPCSERLAVQWHGDFIRLVAKIYGLMDE